MNTDSKSTQSRSGATFVIGMLGCCVAVALWYSTGKNGLPAGPPDYRNLVLKNAQGKNVSLAEYDGRPVMLHFFTTWCDQCQAMAQDLAATSQTMSNEVQIIGVSLDLLPDFQLDDAHFEPESRLEEVKTFLTKHHVDYPVLYDRSGACADALQGRQVPAQVVFDSNMKLLRRFTGERSVEGLRAILQACVNEDRAQQSPRP
ncbi:MAG: hypothetical protein CMO80_05125 [Verrucomicrobiales bacterium]|nr:hypothetical protein [Verrucomicrobiales bacterium]|tara:strand:- start:4480 stop:5085 length:606 start_codon:yes stop_codon:yes gene_type:complete